MSYIAPNTVVRLYKNIPLDKDYKHTLYFPTKEAQDYFFEWGTPGVQGQQYMQLTEQYYQRAGKGKIRVQRSYEQIIDRNYMLFKNTSFENKWFYAFINSIEYVSNNVTEITYEIDVMQTWMFDYTLRECLVEREHTVTDEIGDNIIEENLPIGEYVYYRIQEQWEASAIPDPYLKQSIIVACTFNNDETLSDFEGSGWNNIFSGLNYIKFRNTDDGWEELRQFLRRVGTKRDGIVSMFLMLDDYYYYAGVQTIEFSFPKRYSDLDGYMPKNKKLYTHPYNEVYATNNQGKDQVYRMEFFNSQDCEFITFGDVSCNPSIIHVPKAYLQRQGYDPAMNESWEFIMQLSGFPQISFNTDAFKAWLAQSASNLAASAFGGSMAALAGGNPNVGMNTAVGVVSGVGSLGAKALIQSAIPQAGMARTAHAASATMTMAALGELRIFYYYRTITAQYAKMIDDYFTMFGYACNQVKVPNINARPHWTYCKTFNCEIDGDIPHDDKKKICDIFNNGITHWKDWTEMGNYSLDNSPVTGG